MNKLTFSLIAATLAGAIGVSGYVLWKQQTRPGVFVSSNQPPAAPALPAVPDQPELVPAPDAPAAAASEPAVQYPINAEADKAGGATGKARLPALAQSDDVITKAVSGIVSRKDVLTFLQLDGFARRMVATVDNLARPHAAPLLWPVVPTPGRFSTAPATGAAGAAVGKAAAEVISPANAARYTPLVRFAESIDSARAAAVYVRLYPLFQQTYEELGYPRRYFNDRVVTVIDHLLATPAPDTPPRVKLTQVKGPIDSVRPWVRYEFEDPKLEALSSGQKMLVRVGNDNQARLKTKLKDLRGHIVNSGPERSAAVRP